MKSIVRRDTDESYTEYLKRLADAAGLEASDEAALRRLDRRRKKKGSNVEWVNPHDPEAQITRMKDGRTASVGETPPAAGEAVAEHIAEPTMNGKFEVNAKGVEELVADKGYHSGDVLVDLRRLEVRAYIAEPDRGRRKWAGKQEQQAAVYRNRHG
jgi:transposase